MNQTVFGLVLLLLSSLGGVAAERTVKLAIDNMTCALCPLTVKKALEKVEGVKQVSVDYETKRATVRFDDATTTLESIAQASTNAGYPASKAE